MKKKLLVLMSVLVMATAFTVACGEKADDTSSSSEKKELPSAGTIESALKTACLDPEIVNANAVPTISESTEITEALSGNDMFTKYVEDILDCSISDLKGYYVIIDGATVTVEKK